MESGLKKATKKRPNFLDGLGMFTGKGILNAVFSEGVKPGFLSTCISIIHTAGNTGPLAVLMLT